MGFLSNIFGGGDKPVDVSLEEGAQVFMDGSKNGHYGHINEKAGSTMNFGMMNLNQAPQMVNLKVLDL